MSREGVGLTNLLPLFIQNAVFTGHFCVTILWLEVILDAFKYKEDFGNYKYIVPTYLSNYYILKPL